jgi:hypothetical protein
VNSVRKTLGKLRLFIKCLWVLTALLIFGSYLSRPKLSNLSQAFLDKPLTVEEPVQRRPELPALNFPYHGRSYTIQPIASYRISGLVVSHNNTTGIGDIYHDASSVDLKDLCLVWGSNLDKTVLANTEFWSEPWTCYARPKRGAAYMLNGTELSNNHLIGASEKVRERIRKVGIGDVVTLSGHLINYWDDEAPEYPRKSSLVRNDDGNGACEVIFVTEIEVQATPFKAWRERDRLAWMAFYWVTAIAVISFFLFPYIDYRSIRLE